MPLTRIQLAETYLRQAKQMLLQARSTASQYRYTNVSGNPVVQRQEQQAILALKKVRSLADEAITALNGQNVREDDGRFE